MAQTGYTPIKLYASTTAAAAPLAANLDNTNGAELAINITDGKLFYKDNTDTVQVIAWKNIPVSTISGLGAGVATFLASPTADNLRAAVTDETGTGSLVFATSPTLVTPTLGVATATSINKLSITAPATSATLAIADGKTFTVSNSITFAGTDSTTMTLPPASSSLGYLNVPINSQSAAYTTVLADSGKAILHPSTDANARTFTIDSNANVPYPLGTVITFINMTAQVVTIAITADTMYLAGTGSTGSRSLAQFGMATAVKLTSTTWIISGNGVT